MTLPEEEEDEEWQILIGQTAKAGNILQKPQSIWDERRKNDLNI